MTSSHGNPTSTLAVPSYGPLSMKPYRASGSRIAICRSCSTLVRAAINETPRRLRWYAARRRLAVPSYRAAINETLHSRSAVTARTLRRPRLAVPCTGPLSMKLAYLTGHDRAIIAQRTCSTLYRAAINETWYPVCTAVAMPDLAVPCTGPLSMKHEGFSSFESVNTCSTLNRAAIYETMDTSDALASLWPCSTLVPGRYL